MNPKFGWVYISSLYDCLFCFSLVFLWGRILNFFIFCFSFSFFFFKWIWPGDLFSHPFIQEILQVINRALPHLCFLSVFQLLTSSIAEKWYWDSHRLIRLQLCWVKDVLRCVIWSFFARLIIYMYNFTSAFSVKSKKHRGFLKIIEIKMNYYMLVLPSDQKLKTLYKIFESLSKSL